jgi:two-component system, cell cycle sensor histidine kinase and response regulator CckA
MGPTSSTVHVDADEYSRLLFEEATDGMFVASAEGIYLEVNRSGHRLLGYGDGELVGKHVSALVLGRDQQRLKATLVAMSRGLVSQEIWPMLRKDGSLIHTEVLAQCLSNGAILAIVRELNARSELERQIQASEAKLGSILYTAPSIIMTVDRAGQIAFINRAKEPLTVEQVLGTSCYDYVPPEARARVQRAIEHVFTTRELDEYEVPGPPVSSGDRGWMSVRVGPQIEGDRVVAATLCATDVTAYKAQVARTQELLERLGKITSLVPGVVFQCQLQQDGGVAFTYVSERIREVFHVSPEAACADANAVWAAIHPEDRARVASSFQESARLLASWRQEFRVLFADGEIRWLSGTATSSAATPSPAMQWHGLITDVTDRKQAEAEHARLEEQLLHSQKMESIGQLAGGVAHDFNNLLTAVVAFVELTQEDLPRDTPVREYLDGILAATERGALLTQQLLAFARKKIVTPEDARLNDLLLRLAPMVRRLVGEHIAVELELEPDVETVRIDVGSLEQVIMNLIVNARDAMPRGGQLTLETQMLTLEDGPDQTARQYAVLGVTDTGSGISAEVRARLFEPFFTTKPQGVGTGLGLAMCQGIIEQAGGRISVHSEPGQGSSFRVYLPRAMPAPPVAAAAERPHPAAGGHETILIVEDEPVILRVARAALEKRGYHVLSASDGAEALLVAERAGGHVDLLVTDIVMPRLGGKELSSRLQELRPTLEVLYTSGYAETAIAHHGVLLEGVNFLQKPYTLSSLARRVREVLDRAGACRAI